MSQIKNIVLASSSPFRKKILSSSGISFKAAEPLCDEYLIQDKDPKILALKRSEAKAFSLTNDYPYTLIIGSDQTLSLEDKAYSKAKSAEEAYFQLKELSGKTHFLHTGCVLYSTEKEISTPPQKIWQDCISIPISFRTLSDQEIRNYVETGEWQGTVGSYRLEAQGVQLLSRPILAETAAVVGLPLVALLTELRKNGYLTNFKH